MVGWIRAGQGCVRVGETVWNTLRGNGTKKRGGETNILKRESKLVQGWCLKEDTAQQVGGGGAGVPNIIIEWSKLDEKIKDAISFFLFKSSLLKMGCPYANSTYKTHNPVGIRPLMGLRLGISHLNKHKFRHNFSDCVSLLLSCSIKPETTLYFFLYCRNF